MRYESEAKRLWQHVAVGILGGALFFTVPGEAAVTFNAGFMGYEVIQDWRKHDHSYKDWIGWLVGLGIALGIASILGFVGVV